MNTAIEGPRHCENCKPVECPACGQDVWDRDIGYDKGHLIHGKFIVESRVELRSPKVTCHNCGERYSEESV